MDESDRATEQEEMQRKAALARRMAVPAHDGHCLNCGRECGRAYCDAECREDAEAFERARIRNGG